MDGNRRFRRIHCEVAVGTSVTRRTNTHCDGAELFIYGNSMGCNSIMVDRLLLIPPFHLALLKHEGLPVTLIASMDANRNAEDLVGIDGFSNRVPWRRHRTIDEEFDPAPAQ